MKRIYENAQTVLSWLGTDTEDHKAVSAMQYLKTISNFLCEKLSTSVPELKAMDNITEFVFKHRSSLPVPDECEFSSEAMWDNLTWFYSFTYFTRVWIIQEVNSNRERIAHCGNERIEWDIVELVAGYIIMETAFSKRRGFSNTNTWYAASTTELKRPENWLFMLYLSSNYFCLDSRDVIYGLRGLMKFSKGGELLTPDYTKTTLEVYRDSVEAALVNFENTDVLLYLAGIENPSWIPAWNIPMLFRNPFRFGNRVPWKPAGDSKVVWSIDKSLNVLSLSGCIAGRIQSVRSYNESFFGNTMLTSKDGVETLKKEWSEILKMIEDGASHSVPFSRAVINATANAFSFGLNEKSLVAEENYLLHNFVAYLGIVLDKETYDKYIPLHVSDESRQADGLLFGKPTWDFTYPESSFFITDTGLLGCSVSSSQHGDVIAIPLGSTYPLVLRPDGQRYLIRGFSYTYGIMHGEKQDLTQTVLDLH